MHVAKGLSFVAMLLLFLEGAAMPLNAQTVIHHPRPNEPLRQRWDWALQQPAQLGWRDGFWVGYAIQRWMEENSYVGSFRWPPRGEDVPLAAVIDPSMVGEGRPEASEEDMVRRAAEKALRNLREHQQPAGQVLKKVALLFRFDAGDKNLREIKVSNLSMHVDLAGLPLLWLGEAGDSQSVGLLGELYDDARQAEVREGLIFAIGVHESDAAVVPFLGRVLASQAGDSVREKAAFSLGEHGGKGALELLRTTAQSDRSEGVREKAVFAISMIGSEAAVDVLIDLARKGSTEEVRRKAIFWLGQKASEKAAASLERVLFDSETTKVQEQAVFALAQMPDHRGIPALIRVARSHPNPRVRKKAIFWLGQSRDPRALQALVDIVRGK